MGVKSVGIAVDVKIQHNTFTEMWMGGHQNMTFNKLHTPDQLRGVQLEWKRH